MCDAKERTVRRTMEYHRAFCAARARNPRAVRQSRGREVRCRGRTCRFPRSMQPILEQLRDGTPQPLDRVIEAVAGRLDETAVRTLVGMLVTGANIPAGTFITGIPSATTFTLSQNVTGAGLAATPLDFGTGLENPSFAELATACGLRGFRVEKPEDVRGALQAAFDHDGPGRHRRQSSGTSPYLPPSKWTRWRPVESR